MIVPIVIAMTLDEVLCCLGIKKRYRIINIPGSRTFIPTSILTTHNITLQRTMFIMKQSHKVEIKISMNYDNRINQLIYLINVRNSTSI